MYNKKGTELVHYPAKKSGSTYKIPSSVKYVDCVAFIGNKNIKKIILGKNVKHFDDSALNFRTIGKGCTELEKIVVSKENKYYKSVNGVLYNKKGTKLVVYPAKKSGSTYKLPSTVNYIGCWAFMGNESLKNITIDENVTKIDEGAFKGTKIEHIELSGGKADAGKKLKLMVEAFAQCSNLKEITGGYRVSETGWMTFELCKNLQNMDIGKGLEKLDYSFGGCVSLNKICLSDKLKDINGDAFVDGGCKEFYVEDTNKKYKSIDGSLYEITDSAKGSMKLLFSANTSDFKYVTPDNVVEVSDSAFKGRDAVKEISIGGGVTEFECDSIQNCSGLEILRLSSRVKKVVRFRWDYGRYVSDNNLSNLKKIEVDAGNAKYESYNNELFTKGRKRAILLPYGSKNIIIPKETEEFYGGITLNKFEKIEVEKGNKYFTVKDNVVYDKDITRIIVFPTYKTTYTLPATLKEFPAMTFRYVEDYLDWAGTAEITKADMNLSCVKVAKGKGMSIEAEVGSIGGEEDGVIGKGECADPNECKMIADLGVDMLAAGIGNIHGKYPANWEGLSFETLDAVQQLTGKMPLVLHGGTGIPDDMIKKAISLGVAKINVNTECQLSFADATRKYIEAGKDLEGKGYDPRKLLKPGAEAIQATVKEKMELFGSVGKAE